VRIFFATDLHGSEVCFRKFCAAADFYRCDALILGGDLTGKLLVPIVLRGGRLEYGLGGAAEVRDADELAAVAKRIRNMGYYPILCEEDEGGSFEDGDVYERRLLEESLVRLREWVDYAAGVLGAKDVPVLVAPGNDDRFEVDEAFDGSSVFVMAEQRVVALDGLEVASTGWSNPTPWKTPRECSEEELEERLRTLIASVRDPSRTILNVHVPPYGTTLDMCPELDDDFRVVTVLGTPVLTHAGSQAVREVIEEVQPLVSLHGHIHESRNVTMLGRTPALNPGSEYSEGVLLGAVIETTRTGVRHTLTAG
jgi:Icc-related predicted phosphoesterase